MRTLAVSLAAVALSGCSLVAPQHEVMHVPDVKAAQIFRLRAPKGSDAVVGLNVTIEGKLEGTATVRWGFEGKGIETHEIGPGPVKLKLGGDWYAPESRIDYKPNEVAGGFLGIKYRFRRLKKF